MRITRSAATVLAALTLAVGVPVASGGNTAWAVCGLDLKSPWPGQPRPPKHQGELQVTELKTSPTQITAGGPAVEIPVRITNRTDAAYQEVEPSIGLGHFYDNSIDLKLEDVRVSWKNGTGGWHNLELQPGCTRGIVNEDEALPMLALDKGQSADLTFRIALVSGVPKALDTLNYSIGAATQDRNDGGIGGKLTVNFPKPTPAPPTAAPTTPPVAPQPPRPLPPPQPPPRPHPHPPHSPRPAAGPPTPC
ncbi:hypothetical protein ACFQ0T_04630 [Kitasatospora gansuensis]